MAEVLVEFDAAFPGPGGVAYTPRACARLGDDGLWEGWIEFTDIETGAVIRTTRETTQPTRADVMYWATGLSRVYLEGALARALSPGYTLPPVAVHVEPAYDGPAPVGALADVVPVSRAVLDPFEVYAQGEQVLRQELSALDTDHLRAIVRAYGLGGGVAAESAVPAVLAEYIVAEVRARTEALAPRASAPASAPWPRARGLDTEGPG
jgi:hypothetical protein